jgi:pilus assembly protein FimV
MIITCKKCSANFNLDESLLKPTGSKVQCAKCDDIFVAYPPTLATDSDELTDIISGLEAEQEPKEVAGALEVEDVMDETFEDLDFDLDIEPELKKAAEDLPSSIEPEELDDIDMTMEVESVKAGIGSEDLGDADISEIEKVLEVEETAEDEGISDQVIEDLDLDLDFELETDDAVEDIETEAVFDESDELDMSDIESMLDEEGPEIDEVAEPEEAELELDMEMEPERDMEPEDLEAFTESEELEDADISEIEKMLEVEETTEDKSVADEVMESLALELEPEETVEYDPSGMEPGETVEYDLSGMEPEEADEIDLSDIEAMLDEEEPEIAEVGEPEEFELELDIETEPEIDEAPEDATAAIEPEELDEDDLSGIEEMLEIEEGTEDEMKDEPEGLDPDLDLEDDSDDTVMLEDTLADDLGIFDKAEEAEEFFKAAEPSRTDEVELSFEIEDGDLPGEEEIAGEDEDSFFVETQVLDEMREEPAGLEVIPKKELKAAAKAAKKEEKAAAKVAKKTKKPKPITKRRKRISKPVFALLVLLLIGGGGYGTYTVLDTMNIKVPYVSDIDFKNIKIPYVSDIDFKSIGRKIPYIGNYIAPEVPDPAGNLKIDIFDIKSKFLKNSRIGDLFVVTGKVKNDYSQDRNFIRVTGKLYTKGKKLAKTETIFCGNFLSNNELSKLDLAAMKKRLSNRVGDKKSNMQIKPGKVLPFMVVFSHLPKNLDEFSVQVAGSS